MAFWHQRNAAEAGMFIKESYFFDGSFAAVEEITPSFLCNLVNKSVGFSPENPNIIYYRAG